MILLALTAGCLAFILVLRVTNVVAVTGNAARTAQAAASAMRSPELSDDQKEAQIRQASMRLFKSFIGITLIGVAALAAPAAIVWLGAELGLFDLDEAIDMAMGWPFLVGATVVLLTAWGVSRRLAGKSGAGEAVSGEPGVPYGAMDRMLHRIAFSSPELQKSLADIETKMYRKQIDPETAKRPVFITSLPRAGTTVMLQMLASLPEFASATYRSMPFTLAPLLWSRFSRGFQRSGEEAERAHGDGLKVGFDSPEAFEETVWMAFWADHYQPERIAPWSGAESNPEFEAFFRIYMAKIVAGKGGAANRYISKNNANIARLPLLERLHPDARFVVPIRNPWAHTASMLRQHQRFEKLHAKDSFARGYMEGLGHFEFGAALKPIAFGPNPVSRETAGLPEFWLQYWINAYQTILESAGPRVILVDHDALCSRPDAYLPALARAIEADSEALLVENGRKLLAPPRRVEMPAAPADLVAHAQALHAELVGLSLQPTTAIRQE